MKAVVYSEELDLFGEVSGCFWVDNGAMVSHQVRQVFATLGVDDDVG